jgi:hypothetical protein
MIKPAQEGRAASGDRKQSGGAGGRAEPNEFQRRHSVESSMGGYRSPLVDLDIVVPAGAALGESTTRIDVLRPGSEQARALADAFRDAIADTTYAKHYMRGVDPIPLDVIRELARRACLCRLDQRPRRAGGDPCRVLRAGS